MNKDNKGSRILYIDAAKGIGMLLVILGHTTDCSGLMRGIYSFHMPLFFLCSGMTFSFSENGREFVSRIGKSARRLLLPGLALYGVTSLTAVAQQGSLSVLADQAKKLLWFSGNERQQWGMTIGSVGVIWFLMALFLARMIFDAFHLWRPRRLGLLCLLGTFAGIWLGKRVWLPLSLDVALASLLFLYAGFVLRQKKWPAQASSRQISAALGLWLALWVGGHLSGLEMFDMAKRGYPGLILGHAAALFGGAALLALLSRISEKNRLYRFFTLLGENSMVLLLVHYMAYLLYLYERQCLGAGAVLCLVRILGELLLAGWVILLKRSPALGRLAAVLLWMLLLLPLFFKTWSYLLWGALALLSLWRMRNRPLQRLSAGLTVVGALVSAAFGVAVPLANEKLFAPGKWYDTGTPQGCFVWLLLAFCGYFVMNQLLAFAMDCRGEGQFCRQQGGMLSEKRRKRWLFWGAGLAAAIQFAYLVLCRLPGGLQYDFLDQYAQVVKGSYNAHQPLLHTFFIRAVYNICHLFSRHENTVIFVLALLQLCGYVFLICFLLDTLLRANASDGLLLCVLACYLFQPYHFFFVTFMNKDTFFAYLGTIMIVALYRIVKGMGQRAFNLFFLVAGALGLGLLRSNGWMLLAALLPALLFSEIKKHKLLLAAVTALLCCSMLLWRGALMLPGVENVEFSEAFSVPIQQISRVIAEDRPLLKSQEELCNQLCPVEYVKEAYNPWRSDEIKGQIQFWERDAYLKEHLDEYFALWIELGCSYPKDYVRAWADLTKGYWGMIHTTSDYHHEVYVNSLEIKNHILLPGLNGAINRYLLAFQKLPQLNWLLNIGGCFWVTVLLFFRGLRNKNEMAVLTVPLLALFATLFVAVPLNNEPRYIYLVYAALPFLLALQAPGGGENSLERKK